MAVSIRNGLLMVLLAVMPAGADAGLFAPFHCGGCGPRPWIGFTCAIPLPRPCALRPRCGLRRGGCYQGCGGGYGYGGGGGYGYGGGGGTAYPTPLSYGYGAAPSGCGCGTSFSPPITNVPPITTTPSYAPVPTILPPTNLGPSLQGPLSYAPNPYAQPVCQTAPQRQQFTTYRSVPTTQYRREAYTQNVPVTTYQQITVPRTVYQPQTRYRDVAYTANRQVAQTHTRYVPQTQIGYAPHIPVTAAPCSTCNQGMAYGLSPQFASPSTYSTTVGTLPSYGYPSPTASAVPTPIALPQSAGLPQTPAATLQAPQQSVTSENWETVPQRHAQGETSVQRMGAWMQQSEPRRLQPRRSMFQPAPSAASVWQSRWLR